MAPQKQPTLYAATQTPFICQHKSKPDIDEVFYQTLDDRLVDFLGLAETYLGLWPDIDFWKGFTLNYLSP